MFNKAYFIQFCRVQKISKEEKQQYSNQELGYRHGNYIGLLEILEKHEY